MSRAMKKEVKSVSIYTFSTFITQIGSFLLLPLFWKKLTPTDYGIIGVSEILGTFFGIFWGLSLETYVTRCYYEWGLEEQKKKLGALWVANWGTILIFGALTILLMSLAGRFIFPDVAFFPYIFLGLVHSIFAKMRQLTFSVIRIKQLPWLYFIYSFTIFIVSMTTNILFVLVFNWGLKGYFYAWNLSELLLVIACFILMLRYSKPCIDTAEVKKAVKFSLPLISNALVSNLSNISDRFLLQRFATLEALGIYSLCLKFTKVILLLHESIKMSFVPFMFKEASRDRGAAVENIGKVRMIYLLPLLFTSAAIGIFIADALSIIGQEEYFPIAKYVPWFTFPTLLITFNVYFCSGLLLAKKTKKQWYPAFLQLVLIISCGLVLIPRFQIVGIGISRYITTIVFMTFSVYLSQKYYPIPIPRLKISAVLILFVTVISIAYTVKISSIVVSIAVHVFLQVVFMAVISFIVIGRKHTIHYLQSVFRQKMDMVSSV